MFGNCEAERICFPDCGDNLMNQQQQKMTLELLNAADRGVVLQVRNGSIYATRKCRYTQHVCYYNVDHNFLPITIRSIKRTVGVDCLTTP